MNCGLRLTSTAKIAIMLEWLFFTGSDSIGHSIL